MKIDDRLNGDTFCKRCGQRYKANGDLIPSTDRRQIIKKCKLNKETII